MTAVVKYELPWIKDRLLSESEYAEKESILKDLSSFFKMRFMGREDLTGISTLNNRILQVKICSPGLQHDLKLMAGALENYRARLKEKADSENPHLFFGHLEPTDVEKGVLDAMAGLKKILPKPLMEEQLKKIEEAERSKESDRKWVSARSEKIKSLDYFHKGLTPEEANKIVANSEVGSYLIIDKEMGVLYLFKFKNAEGKISSYNVSVHPKGYTVVNVETRGHSRRIGVHESEELDPLPTIKKAIERDNSTKRTNFSLTKAIAAIN